MTWRRFAGLAALAPALTACPQETKPNETGEANPIASTPPAPLASGAELITQPAGSGRPGRVGIPADSAGRLIVPDAGRPPPEPIRHDEALSRDTLTQRDGVGITLAAKWIWRDVPKPAAEPEANEDGIQASRDKTELSMTVDLAYAGRMRLAFTSAAFPLPAGTEIRSREDRYGHTLVWPNGNAYRALAPGAMRALFAERRADVTPLVAGTVKELGKGTLIGLPTLRSQVKTPTGTATIEQADVVTAGRAGALLCRTLLELNAVQPSTPVCKRSRVPLKAAFEWAGGGGITFEVSTMTRRQDIPIGVVYVPPSGAQFKPAELPPEASGVFLSRADLLSFRNTEKKPPEPPGPDAPGEGAYAVNQTDTLRYVLIDGVPVAWVRPRQQQYIIGPRAGRYSVGWRDFFGAHVTPPEVVQFPAKVIVGGKADAGK